jgi:uncharacterized membrane protein YbhN (UPF0104 family)
MQITHNHKKIAGWILRLIILSLSIWFIASQVDEKWTLDTRILEGKWVVIALVLLLAIVNWALEVVRWKWSLDSLGPHNWIPALSQVFGGLALNWILPFTSGDLMARLLPNDDKKQVAVLIFYNRVIMLALTVLVGAFGVYIYSAELFDLQRWPMGLAVFIIYFLSVFVRQYARDKGYLLSTQLLIRLSIVSVIRYAVFTSQFYLLIWAFNPTLDASVIIGGIGWIFLFRSVIPSLFGNLGVREASALVFFQSYVPDMMLILAPSLLIWLINTVAPSILGLYYLLKFRVNLDS